MKRPLLISGICMLLLFFAPNLSFGQSDHYWTQNFNTESSLLGSAVVGGYAGPSAVYYNPALINQQGTEKFALSANLFSFHTMKIENLIGEGTIYDNLVLKVQPKFVSFSESPKKNPKWTFEFAFLVPLSTDIRFDYLYDTLTDIIHRLDGMEDYEAYIVYESYYDDYYIGGGASYKISDRFTIGASAFFSLKSLKYRYATTLSAMQKSDTVYSNGIPEPFYSARRTSSEELRYTDVSLLFKIGFHYASGNGNWGIGLKLSTPNLHILGQGDVRKEYHRANVFDNSTNHFTPNLDFSSYQSDVKTKVKDPVSIAFGLNLKTSNRKHALFFTTEYFAPIDLYPLLKTTDSKVIGNIQVENVAEAMTFYASAREVLNFGIGYRSKINERFTLNFGFKTDYNAMYESRQKIEHDFWYNPRLSELYFDKFHFVAGPSVALNRFGFILGLQYTMGRKDNLNQFFNLTNPVEYDPTTYKSLQGTVQNNMKLRYNEISIFFGITYGLTN